MTVALGAMAIRASHNLMAQSAALPVSLLLDPSVKLTTIPEDFMGLSYESGQLAYPDFFSPGNKVLIELFRTLSPSGVLRLGGNLSEFTVWSNTEPSTPPEPNGLVGPDPGHREPRTYTITPRSIQNLRGFLDATGWRCIYGLNLGGGTLEQALAEGSYVAKTLQSKLICVQFGNEPDLFKHHDQNNKPWTYEEYIAKWKAFRAAFHEMLPSVSVAGPDTATNQEWVKRFAQDAAKDVVMLTSHYYPEGPPTDPKMTLDLLLHPGQRFDYSCREALKTAKAAGLPFRMAEGNSCYNAGKQGVSDTFGAALWAGDFCLQMASMGCVGVNLHSGAHGYYSPIIGSIQEGFSTRPEFYGMLTAQHLAGYTLHKTELDTQGANITAYAGIRANGSGLVIIFNKGAHNADVTLSAPAGSIRRAELQRLQAPSLDSETGTTIGGVETESNGQLHAHPAKPLSVVHDAVKISVPAYSTALVRLNA